MALMLVMAVTLSGAQTLTVIYTFDNTDGQWPMGTLAQGRDGNLYGTTVWGGDNNNGTVFRITASGALTALYKFDGVHGSDPFGGLTLGTDGNFYGTTSGGGAYGDGTIFKITKSGNLTTLYSFTGGLDGSGPSAAPVQASDGNFYGTTSQGTVYKITPAGKITVLGSAPGSSATALLQGTDGNFYGTTYDGGSTGNGTAFKITPRGVATVLYNFDIPYGTVPRTALVQSTDGNFYGVTSEGGDTSCQPPFGCGTVFELTPDGVLTVLNTIGGAGYPYYLTWNVATMLQATDGNLYGGTTGGGIDYGTIFQITDGTYSVLHNFDFSDGWQACTPMQQTNGMIYGATMGGGALGYGVLYSFDVGQGPFVSLVPTSRKVGKSIGILGQGFTGTTTVSFNGTGAAFKVWSDTYLVAAVPEGATSGFVTVTTPGGTLTSNRQFRVRP